MKIWAQRCLLALIVFALPVTGHALGLLEEVELHGFFDARGGTRTQSDPYQRDTSLLESRLQLSMEHFGDQMTLQVRGDLLYDNVAEHQTPDLEKGEGVFDLREANLFFSPTDIVDVKIGRQILTWGTGDLLFINDLFPKDWQSFFIGRDEEYLKAPSDALFISLFPEFANIDLVYIPRFNSDRHLTGERLSFNGFSGTPIETDKPDRWFNDHEFSLRVSQNLAGYEIAAYGYYGYWKSPAGFDSTTDLALFPRLNVYGASVRGDLQGGIFNLEGGYYDSRDDNGPESELRLLAGYERELAKELTGSLQFYLEDDENRQVWTLRLTKQLLGQKLTLSLFNYWSPSDEDYYLRPQVRYKLTDAWLLTCGGNLFGGDQPETFFAQLEDNTNIYAGIRYSF